MSVSSARCRSPACLVSSMSRLELSTPPSTLRPQHRTPLIQHRHASTPRRFRKLLNQPPAPVNPEAQAAHTPTGSSGRSRRPRDVPAAGDTVVYNPPASAPNPHHTPPLFLPRDDPRRALAAQHARLPTRRASGAAGLAEVDAAAPPPLPPALRQPGEKKYHLGPKEIEEMRALRQRDEATWTRGALAKRFDCSSTFVGMVVQASDARRQQAAEALEQRRQYVWGPKRRKARDDRVKRREMWKYD